jgi:hypothetical protein
MFTVIYGTHMIAATATDTFQTAHAANNERLAKRSEGYEALYCSENEIEATKAKINCRTGYKAPVVPKATKPARYGKLGVYWHSGSDQRTEEFDSKTEANARFAELKKLGGQLAILKPEYLVVDVEFPDGGRYTYFALKKHKVGTKLYVPDGNDYFHLKEVKVVKAAYWATREQLEQKCMLERFKVAYATKHILVSADD